MTTQRDLAEATLRGMSSLESTERNAFLSGACSDDLRPALTDRSSSERFGTDSKPSTNNLPFSSSPDRHLASSQCEHYKSSIPLTVTNDVMTGMIGKAVGTL